MPLFLILFALLLIFPLVWPLADLLASGAFYRAGDGFFLADNSVLEAVHIVANVGARALVVVFAALALGAFVRSRLRAGEKHEKDGSIGGLSSKSWLFLLLALLIGPGLVANVGFKDHWGRARPREVVEFGGTQAFSPALAPHFETARSNGSFVCGDGAFGFFFPAFGFVAPRRYSRRVFWAGMGVGCAFSFVRLAVGAHFLSDIIYAAFFMLLVTSALHAALFGRAETKARWQGFFRPPSGV